MFFRVRFDTAVSVNHFGSIMVSPRHPRIKPDDARATGRGQTTNHPKHPVSLVLRTSPATTLV
jgi:hypothetical protein